MTFLLMWEGAEKCALRHLRRAEDTAALNFIAAITNQTRKMLEFEQEAKDASRWQLAQSFSHRIWQHEALNLYLSSPALTFSDTENRPRAQFFLASQSPGAFFFLKIKNRKQNV